MPHLIVTNGPQAETRFEVANRPLAIGRDPSRDIQIVDPKVSRKHAMIRRIGPDCAIAPAKALNAILVNGEPIDGPALLRDGDAITLGDTILLFSEGTAEGGTDGVHQRKNADRSMRESHTIM